MKAFSPSKALASNSSNIPDFVIEVVNEMLATKYSKGSRVCRLVQKDIVEAIKLKIGPDVPFQNEWLDFEPIYEKEGWTVRYDKPGYNEFYDASFNFYV